MVAVIEDLVDPVKSPGLGIALQRCPKFKQGTWASSCPLATPGSIIMLGEDLCDNIPNSLGWVCQP